MLNKHRTEFAEAAEGEFLDRFDLAPELALLHRHAASLAELNASYLGGLIDFRERQSDTPAASGEMLVLR